MNTINSIIPALYAAIVCMVSISDARAETNATLTVRQKAIIPIAAFTATGNLPKLETAIHAGLDEGLTINEIKEILIHSYAYTGFPRALNGIDTFMAVLEKRKEQGINDHAGKDTTPVPLDFDKNAYGHKVRNTLVGRDISKRTSGYPVFTPIVDQFLVEHLFADIFYRDVLNYQERELATIGILAALTGTEPQLKGHLSVSMNVGLSKAQLEDYVAVLKQQVSVESAERATEALNELLGTSAPVNRTKSVKVIRNGSPIKGSNDYFTGSVTVESRFACEIQDSYRGGIVNFSAGARTAWHTHPLGQTLIVISGSGLVQQEGQALQKMEEKDVVWIPANTRHWHGASEDSPMSHVAISTPLDGKTVEWMEKVGTEQYANKSLFKNQGENP